MKPKDQATMPTLALKLGDTAHISGLAILLRMWAVEANKEPKVDTIPS